MEGRTRVCLTLWVALKTRLWGRLKDKKGVILGPGATATQVKVLLDGAKAFIALHVRYVDLLQRD